MITDKQIEKAMTEQAKNFGYSKASCEVTDFKDFKVRWTRTTTTIAFTVSDYFRYLSVEAVSDIAKKVLSSIVNKDVSYSENTKNELTSRDFCMCAQPIYLERTDGVLTDEYDYILEELVKDGKVRAEDVEGIIIAKSNSFGLMIAKSTHASLFRTILISSALDNKNEIECSIKHSLCNLLKGLEVFGKEIDTSKIE